MDLGHGLVDSEPLELRLVQGSRVFTRINGAAVLGAAHLFQYYTLRSVRAADGTTFQLLIGKAWALLLVGLTFLLFLLLFAFTLLFETRFLRSRRLRPAPIEVYILE